MLPIRSLFCVYKCSTRSIDYAGETWTRSCRPNLQQVQQTWSSGHSVKTKPLANAAGRSPVSMSV